MSDQARGVDAMNWIATTERLPENCAPVLVFVRLENGKSLRLRAMYVRERELELADDCEGGEYDEDTDQYWCVPGWYENNQYEETHWLIDADVTHWMPLPKPPLLFPDTELIRVADKEHTE